MKFTEILEAEGIEVRTEGNEHCRAGWAQIDCPFCGELGTQRFHLGYNLRGNYLTCWVCGRHGLLETLVEVGIEERKARQLLGTLDLGEYVPEVRHRGKLLLPKGVGPLLPQHRRYLKERGFEDVDKLVRLWQIAGIGMIGEHKWRVFIPILLQGKVVSWTTRSISDDPDVLRYKSAGTDQESVPHKQILYGEDYCRHAIVVQEGPLDVWTVGPGSVCTCGTGFSRGQVLRISRFPVRVVCFDNEPVAQRQARNLCDMLAPFPGDTYNIQWETGKDASRADPQEVAELRRRFLE